MAIWFPFDAINNLCNLKSSNSNFIWKSYFKNMYVLMMVKNANELWHVIYFVMYATACLKESAPKYDETSPSLSHDLQMEDHFMKASCLICPPELNVWAGVIRGHGPWEGTYPCPSRPICMRVSDSNNNMGLYCVVGGPDTAWNAGI